MSSARWTLRQDLEFYAGHDIDTVALAFAKFEAAGVDAAIAAVRDRGLVVNMLFGIGRLPLDRPDAWAEPRARFAEIVDTAVAIESESVMATTGLAGQLTWEEAADALELAMAPGLSYARDRGMPVMFEHTNSLRVDVGFVHTLRDMIDVARRLGAGVLMEVNACWMERDLAATIRAGLDTIALVQVSDFAVGTCDTPNRLVPGDGDIPLERIVATLLHAGYAGRFDLEVLGPRIDEAGYETAIPRSVEWLSNLLDRLGA